MSDDTIMVPGEIVMAISAQRPEFLRIAPKQLDEQSIQGVYKALGQLIQMNFDQQKRIERMEKRIEEAWRDAGLLKASIADALRNADALRERLSVEGEDDEC
jgi:hypothetical protein